MEDKTDNYIQVKNALEAVKDTKVEQFYFVACGGSMATLETGQYIFDRESSIPSRTFNSKEFVCLNPKRLGKNSVVILCSHSGKTPETAEAAAFARERGALTLSISNGTASPLSKASDYLIHYSWGDDVSASDGLSGTLFSLLFGILEITDQYSKCKGAAESIKNLQSCIDTNKEKFKQAALTFAQEYRKETLMYTMASGGLYPEAYALTACFLMEMQWIHSGSIHSGEYFHGPLEVTDTDVPFILLKSIGDARIMDDRAHAFLKTMTNKLTVIDADDFMMEGIDEDLKTYFSQAIMTEVVKIHVEAMAEARGHMMSVRRYMGKLEY